MNRLGFRVEEALALARDPLLADLEPALVMSHLVSAEEPRTRSTGARSRLSRGCAQRFRACPRRCQFVRHLPA
jgi:alanine racemase